MVDSSGRNYQLLLLKRRILMHHLGFLPMLRKVIELLYQGNLIKASLFTAVGIAFDD